MILNANLCNTSSLLYVFLIMKIVISIVCVLVPIIVMFMVFKDVFASVIKGDSKEAINILQMNGKRLVAGLIIFLIPSGINFAFSLVNADMNSISACYKEASLQKINSLKMSEKAKLEEERKKEKEKLENDFNERNENDKKENEERRKEKENQGSTNVPKNIQELINGAKKADERTFKNGYHYADAHSFDGTNMKDASGLNSASCDRGVALSLYLAGYTDMSPNELSLGNLDRYLQGKGWKKITNYNDLQPGDIVFYDRDHNGTLEASDHTFLIGEEMGLTYDWGSDARIKHQGQFSGGMPFHEGVIQGDFGWAYRMP